MSNTLADNGSWKTLALNVVTGAALVASASWFSYTLFNAREASINPREVESIVLEPTILTAGQPFFAHVKVKLNKLCPYEVHWSLVRRSDNVEIVKIIEPTVQPPAALGEQELPTKKRFVPSSVDPGEYTYVSEVFDHCSDHIYTSVRRNVNLTIR